MPERKLPRPFSYHWGEGEIIEEASVVGEHHEPALQLLEYRGGELDGRQAVRFCYYSLDGRFQRSPLLVNQGELSALRDALRSAPRLRELLRGLLTD